MVIVAVVGAAHVEGIARRWREKSAKERKRE
jgi:pheromone shutdown protein TraB